MENSIKISCNHAAYVEKFNSNTNFSQSNSLLIGAITNKSSDVNLYMSILNFHISDLEPDSIKEASLFLFVEDIKSTNKGSWHLGLFGNFDNIDISTIDWTSFPNNNFTKLSTTIIPNDPIGSYLKVDVTSLIKSLAEYSLNYNILLIPVKTNSNAIVKLASIGSNNSPYLSITTYDTDNSEASETSDTDTYDELIEMNTYASVSNSASDNNTSQEFLDKIINAITEHDSILVSIKDILSNNQDHVITQNMVTSNSENLKNQLSILDESQSNKLASLSDNLENQNSVLDFIKNEVSNDTSFLLTKDLLNKIINTTTEHHSTLASIKDILSSNQDHVITQNIVTSISDTLKNQLSILDESQSNKLSSLENGLVNNLSEKNITLSQKLIDYITSKFNDQDSILNLIKNEVSNEESFILTKDLLNKVTKILINQDSKLDSYNNSLNDTMDIFSKKLDNIDNKIESLDDKIINAVKNSTESLNNDIIKLISMLNPLTESVEALKTNMDNLKNDINSKISSFQVTNKNESIEFNYISSELSELSSNLKSLLEMVTCITIEPLN